MNKKITCIECPKGCSLSVDYENCKAIKVEGTKCPKGIGYAISEIENPSRILTATVVATGLGLKLVPVRTNKPIPKKDILKAMEEIRLVKVTTPLEAGDIIVENFLNLGVKLVATREVAC